MNSLIHQHIFCKSVTLCDHIVAVTFVVEAQLFSPGGTEVSCIWPIVMTD